MSELELRNALLQNDGGAPSDSELMMLWRLIDAEQRRSRRLAFWSLIAWIGWVVCLAAMVLLPLWMARPQVPAGQPPMPVAPESLLLSVSLKALSLVIILGAIGLPVIGTVLIVLHFIANRSVMSNHWLTTRFREIRSL